MHSLITNTTFLLVLYLPLLLLNPSTALAHMQLHFPPALKASNNPHTIGHPKVPLYFPFDCCGKKTVYPCGGHLDLLGTSEGKSVISWEAGSIANFSLIGGTGNHWGGSCQVGFSIDNGTTFRVATSYEGNCPHRNGGWTNPEAQTFNFTIPADLPEGNAIFAWNWFNREQEFNMNCAVVSIKSPTSEPLSYPSLSLSLSSPSPPSYHYRRGWRRHNHTSSLHLEAPCSRSAAADPSPTYSSPSTMAWKDRPEMLVADIGNGCLTPHTTAEVKYPNPGPDVVPGDGVYPLVLPTPAQACGYVAGY
ncbi:MAG: hypothetical protein M1834_005957 [Cirrosporium novae-zelandiae]|nr:MAG: hypothetical protein M1834_005957 [Cirrosporium novae-zelandiae]